MTSQGPVVCVVDDDPSVRVALRRLLNSSGWTARTFASAEEFLEDGIHSGCDCVVADVHLGKMSGLELQATLAGRADPVPVIVVSGVADASMELEARRLGAVAFFRKPFDVDALLEAIGRATGVAIS
jgi:FixJ family two-component response regulator